MKKIRFAIVGSGWRSLYYVRIAKALKDHFELCAMLCRTEEKAQYIKETCQINAITSIEGCVSLQPDFVVVAVDKAHIASVSIEWLQRGFPVLCETPATMQIADLEELWKLHEEGSRIITAEQYRCYPINTARKTLLDMGLIGEAQFLYLSLAHEYHAVSLMRSFLQIEAGTPFSVQARDLTFPTRETLSRYERFTDGRISGKTRVNALFSFENGKACLYDFDSEQYRSPIRNDSFRIDGISGQILNDTVYWIDGKSQTQQKSLHIDSYTVETGNKNPNLDHFEEVTNISFLDQNIYLPPFGSRGLSQDETAIASLLRDMSEYVNGGMEPYPLKDALEDAYAAILLRRSIHEKRTIHSGKMIWHG
jgi:predicted dehydrogenase